MKAKKLVLLAVVVSIVGLFVACENNDTAENDALYEVHSVDKRDIERPGDQGGN